MSRERERNVVSLQARAQADALKRWPSEGLGESEPEPPPTLGEIEPFPVDALGPLEPLVQAGIHAFGCPADFLGGPLLAAAGAAIGGTRLLELKKGHRQHAGLYLATVGDPGTTKSPPFDLAVEHIRKQDDELHGDMLNGKLRAWTSDVTVESLAGMLADNPRGIFLARDELSGWIQSLNQYKANGGADRKFFLDNWSRSRIRQDRKKAESIRGNPSFLAVCGTIQPDVLKGLPRQNDGFMDRFLFCYPEAQATKWKDAYIDHATLDNTKKIFNRLFAFRFGADDQPQIVTLSHRAQKSWIDLYNELIDEENAPDFWPVLKGPWSKLRVYAARFALIHHSLLVVSESDWKELELEPVSIMAAHKLVEYFRAMARRVYALFTEPPGEALVRRVIEWLARHPEGVRPRDILNAKITRTIQDAEKLCVLLVKRGLARWQEQGKSMAGQEQKPRLVCVPSKP